MTDAVTLEFLARQMERVLTRLGSIEDQLTVLTGMAIRHDGSLAGLATEFRGLVQATNRADHRLRKLEDQES
jgi:uncharacterized protein YigA (DUF484 family)